MNEEPLHLLPRHLRREFEKMLGVHIEGDLCPVCRFRLKDEFGQRYEEVPICVRSFSKRNRVGIGVVPPVDPWMPRPKGSIQWSRKAASWSAAQSATDAWSVSSESSAPESSPPRRGGRSRAGGRHTPAWSRRSSAG